jgi:hypothetical protein
VVLFSILFHIALVPVLQKNELLDKKIALGRKKLMSYRLLLSQKETIKNAYSSFFSKAPGWGKRGDTSVDALFILENLAQEAGIRIVEIRPRGGMDEGSTGKNAVFFLRTEGALEGYVKFMYELENPLSLIHIESFQLSTGSNVQAFEGSFVVAGEDLKRE